MDNYKPDWYQSEDKNTQIEWNPDGHANMNEGPHIPNGNQNTGFKR